MRRIGSIATLGLVLGIAVLSPVSARLTGQHLHAQSPGLERAVLLETPLTGIEDRKLVIVSATLAPGAAAGRHYHHGDEIVYVLEGRGVLEIDGRPAVLLEPGDSYHLPSGLVHDVRSDGATPVRALVIFVVDRASPMAVPVP
jgi:quercetin dioxygenase-like cupin family protein